MKTFIYKMAIAPIFLVALIGTAKAQSQTRYLIEGEDPAKYYSDFRFQVSGTCAAQNVYFQFLSSYFIKTKIGVNDQGQDIVVDLDIYMLTDSDYMALYEEHDVLHYTELGYAYRVTRPRIVRGKYQVVDDKLVLSGLGTASALRYNDKKAIELEMSEDLISPGLKGLVLLIGKASSSYMPVPELDPCTH